MNSINEITNNPIDLDEPNIQIVYVNVNELKFHPIISYLFMRQPGIIEKIIASMKEKGYDLSEPIVIGIIKDIGEYIVDGHTRTEAALKANLTKVAVTYKNFQSLEDAIQYTYDRQANRRNITQGGIIMTVMHSEKKTKRDGKGRMANLLSKNLGISSATVVHAKTVLAKATKEDIEKIINGEATINSIYQKIRQKKQDKDSKTDVKNSPLPNPNKQKNKKPTLKEFSIKNDNKRISSKIFFVSLNELFIFLKNNDYPDVIEKLVNHYRNFCTGYDFTVKEIDEFQREKKIIELKINDPTVINKDKKDTIYINL